jgi:hypothetical protein
LSTQKRIFLYILLNQDNNALMNQKTDKPAKKRKLTPKVRKIVKAVAEGKTQREAAKIADASETYVSEVLKKTEVIETIQSLMAKHGLDDASILRAHSEMMQATKVVSAIGGKDAGAGSVDFIDVPDWQARGKAIEMGYKLKGAFVEKKEVTFPEGLSIEVSYRGTNDKG